MGDEGVKALLQRQAHRKNKKGRTLSRECVAIKSIFIGIETRVDLLSISPQFLGDLHLGLL